MLSAPVAQAHSDCASEVGRDGKQVVAERKGEKLPTAERCGT